MECDKEKVKRICIDDFALRKRQRYGTIMVDTDSRRIIDMIETRETEEVTQWLSTFPNVEVVSRDGSTTYASAITNGLPKAVQVSDRFHLLQNLCDKANKYFQRIFQGRVAIPMTNESERRKQILSLGTKEEKSRLLKALSGEGRTMSEIEMITGMSKDAVRKYVNMNDVYITDRENQTVRGKEHDDAVQKVQERADIVRQMKSEGVSIAEIVRKTGFKSDTVQRYLSDGFTPVNGHYGRRREGKLYCFRNNVLQMRAESKTYAYIYNIIRAQGYTGTVDAIRGFISKERRITNDIQSRVGQVELIEKKWLVSLLYKPLKDVPALTKEQFISVLKTYPLTAPIYRLVNRFRGIVKRRDVAKLGKWIVDAASLDIDEICAFTNGLKNDLPAVTNALIYDYNNGLAEGSVNKVKVIKRIMYGRCRFGTLKNKVLLLEQSRSFN